MSGTRTVAKAGTTFEVAARGDHAAFWDWYETDAWEPETVAVFERFLRAQARYVDLGAWIGPTVLLAAPSVARVVCVEPDPRAFSDLTENVSLNPSTAAKTLVLPVAVGAHDGSVTLTSAGEGGDSNSSVARSGDTGARWEVEQVSVRTLLDRAGLGTADFVKIDIEGAEYDVIPSLCSTLLDRPTLFVALHPNLLVDKSSLAARIWSSFRALRANRRFLRALLVYRHHYVYDESDRRFRDVRTRNLVRVLLPLPFRASFLIGACVFTNERIA